MPTLAELREQIKIESRVAGADNLDTFIDGVVNEQLVNFAGKNRYLEFLKTNVELPTIEKVDAYPLPADFSVPRLIRYRNTTGYTRTLNPRPTYIETARGNLPRWYDVAGLELKIFPVDDLTTGETLLLDYYSVPPTLTSLTQFPVPRLLSQVKLETIRRVLIFNRELNEAQIIKGDAVELEGRTRPTRG